MPRTAGGPKIWGMCRSYLCDALGGMSTNQHEPMALDVLL